MSTTPQAKGIGLDSFGTPSTHADHADQLRDPPRTAPNSEVRFWMRESLQDSEKSMENKIFFGAWMQEFGRGLMRNLPRHEEPMDGNPWAFPAELIHQTPIGPLTVSFSLRVFPSSQIPVRHKKTIPVMAGTTVGFQHSGLYQISVGAFNRT
jgi:hypothetical protein